MIKSQDQKQERQLSNHNEGEEEDHRLTRATEGGLSSMPKDGLRVSKWNKTLCTDIKLIDFGGATFEDDHHTTIINTR